MPIRIRVDLEPAVPGRARSRHTGHVVNAAVLAAIREQVSPSLSQAMHSPPGYKPYTVTPLMDGQCHAAGKHEGPAWFGVSVLDDGLAAPVLTALEAAPHLRIGRSSYRNVKATVPMSATYEDLLAGAPRTTWEFTMVTPSGFATSRGEGPRREIPWPDPARVFASLARRWAHFASAVPLPEDLDAAVRASIEVTDFDIRLAPYLVKTGEPLRHGAIGQVTYKLAGAEHLTAPVISAVNALAGYAEYAGFGDRTAMGMGYVRLL